MREVKSDISLPEGGRVGEKNLHDVKLEITRL